MNITRILFIHLFFDQIISLIFRGKSMTIFRLPQDLPSTTSEQWVSAAAVQLWKAALSMAHITPSCHHMNPVPKTKCNIPFKTELHFISSSQDWDHPGNTLWQIRLYYPSCSQIHPCSVVTKAGQSQWSENEMSMTHLHEICLLHTLSGAQFHKAISEFCSNLYYIYNLKACFRNLRHRSFCSLNNAVLRQMCSNLYI